MLKSFKKARVYKKGYSAWGSNSYMKPAPPTVEMATRRFECVGYGANKFWEIKAEQVPGIYAPYVVETKYGKMGTNGTVSTKDFYNQKSMQTFIQKKIQEKLDKGYMEVGPEAAFPMSTPAIPSLPNKGTIADLKKTVKEYAKGLADYVPVGMPAEVIVTVMVGGEVIQETIKK